MIQLYEVLYKVGEDELKKYVAAKDEEDLQQHIQNIAGAAYFMVAEGNDLDFSGITGPTQLTKDQTLGVWVET